MKDENFFAILRFNFKKNLQRNLGKNNEISRRIGMRSLQEYR